MMLVSAESEHSRLPKR